MAGPIPAIGQVYRVTYDLTMFGQKLMSTFSYRLSTLGTEADTDAVCTGLRNAMVGGMIFEGTYQLAIPGQVTWDNVWVQCIYPVRVRKLVFAKAVIGSNAGVASTANVAASIERRGALANRNNVGRLQLPAPTDAASIGSGSIPPGAYLTSLTNFAAKVILPATTALGAVLGPVLTKNPIDATFANVIEAFAKTTVRVMHRRTVGVGK